MRVRDLQHGVVTEEVRAMLNHRCALGAAFVLLLTLSMGCSSSGTISAPSSSSQGGSATIVGTFSGATSGPSVREANSASSTITVTVVGTGISATVGPGESFTLNGVPTGDVTLQISSASGTLAQVMIPAVQNQEQVRVAVSVRGSSASITITERTMPANGNQARVRGAITSIDSIARTFVVDGVTVSVPANMPVSGDDHALAFADLKVGQRVTVTGTFSGAILVASKIVSGEEN